jgi:hypothetical protein
MTFRLRIAVCIGVLLSCHLAWSQPKPPQIALPDLLAVELPAGMADLGPDDAPLHDLLAGAHSGNLRIDTNLTARLAAGPATVTWTAHDAAGKPLTTRKAVILVLPHGLTPVGTSGDENASGGNNAVRIVHDDSGHIHMIWVDSGGPSGRTGPVYRRAALAASGAVTLETPPIYVADITPGDWNAYPSLALDGASVQLAWQGGGTVHTRRLSPDATGFAMGPVVDTKAKGNGRDIGPAIAADQRGLHIVTPDGLYTFSGNGGTSWTTATIPLPPGHKIKTISLAPNGKGDVDIGFSSVTPQPKDKSIGGWWQFRTLRRTADGQWIDPVEVLAGKPGWSQPPAGEDALVDWVRLAADGQGGLHAAWHGTAISHKYGNDSSFYAWRDPSGTWHEPVRLIAPDPAGYTRFSFAPSIALDGEKAMALSFYDVYAGTNWIGFDSAAGVLRDGTMAKPGTPISQFVASALAAGKQDNALSTRFPAAAPTLWHAPDGHVWLDMLETLIPSAPGFEGKIIVYHRVDVTSALR